MKWSKFKHYSFWIGAFLIGEGVGSILYFWNQPCLFHLGRLARVIIGVVVLNLDS